MKICLQVNKYLILALLLTGCAHAQPNVDYILSLAKTCSDLGITKNTPQFDQCVMTLHNRSQPAVAQRELPYCYGNNWLRAQGKCKDPETTHCGRALGGGIVCTTTR
jgi:hypothetical protein